LKFERAGGILLHPTSFPGSYGIGDLGAEAYEWVDFLRDAGQKLWQILPLGPTGYGDSPYACFSAFAGNPLLISPDILLGQGLLPFDELEGVPEFSETLVEYGKVLEWKMKLLQSSYAIYKERASEEVQAEVKTFEAENAAWLNDYAFFMACKTVHEGATWNTWEPGLAQRDPATILEWTLKLADEIGFQKYLQFLFFQQWQSLRDYANEQGIRIMGDIPIFVAYDSAEVWAHPELFYLDDEGNSTVVAGVPPDYFSATGQRWGNPLYRWDKLRDTGFTWWLERFRTVLKQVDYVRLDHFRGFEAYWEVPANEETAINGRWVKGPGEDLFKAVSIALGDLPIIAEDLGLITPEVAALRENLGFPGMRVLQFAFNGDPADAYLPHNYVPETLVYTGTHDNDTTAGWLAKATPEEQDFLMRYLVQSKPESIEIVTWRLIRLAWSSVAHLAIVPLQDLFALGSEARMNAPGRAAGNWGWRYTADMLTGELKEKLLDMSTLYGRYAVSKPEIEAES
jgi:4-alpha-glucanotransferase